MRNINKTKIMELIECATDVFKHNDKLIIDNGLKRAIIYNIEDSKEYLKRFNEIVDSKTEDKNYVYCEENLRLILANYPDPEKRGWLVEKINLPIDKIADKYSSMIISYKKNNRYSKQYWREELEELRKNKNNLEYHAEKYNRSVKNLKDILKRQNL